MKRVSLLLFISFLPFSVAAAQTYSGKFLEANYDESKVPEYTLPDVLTSFSGQTINTVKAWESTRRPEIIKFFAENLYGEVPEPSSPIQKSFKLVSEDSNVLHGLCTRKDVEVTFKNKAGSVTMPLALFVPNKAKEANERVPVILLSGGSDIRRKNLALDDSQRFGKTRNGIPLHQLMMRGIGVATVDYEAFGKDNRNREGKISGGIVDLFLKPGQKWPCLLYTSPSPRDATLSRMPSSA